MPKHDVIVIGGGPGGYVAALRAAQLGFNVGCVELEAALGGTCVRVGCIPSKALLESSERYHEAQTEMERHGVLVKNVKLDLERMLSRKDEVVKANSDGVAFLFKKNKIKRYRGRGEITGPGRVVVHGEDGREELEGKHLVIATGSQVSTLPGVELDGDRVGSSAEALAYRKPPNHLVVIGAGYIGLELGAVWRRLGSKVTVLEYFDRILPGMDAELARDALKTFKKQGIEFRLGLRVTGVRVTGVRVTGVRVTGTKAQGNGAMVEIEGGEEIEADRVLVAVGRKPNTEGLGLDSVGVELDERGRVKVDGRFATNVDGIYAIGDVIAGPMLAHKAEEEGVALAEMLAGEAGHVNYEVIPGIVYTEPEIATVGKSEEQLKEQKIAYKKGVFPYLANGRARALGATDGKVKILAHAQTDRILGVHIIGARAGDLISEAVVAMNFSASSEDLARTVHAHPTLSEVVREAALAVEGRALHM
ncbi:MAG: dihydrolipoyl dehydrogenase [Trueperaceae bacterium]